MNKIAIGIMTLILMTSVVSAYSSWSDVINDYTYLTYRTGNTYEPATSMTEVINRIFWMRFQLEKPKPVIRHRGGGGSSPSSSPSVETSVEGDLNDDGIKDAQDFTIFKESFQNDYGTECEECAGDLNEDGIVDSQDFTIYKDSLN